jgi:hypothetical protein
MATAQEPFRVGVEGVEIDVRVLDRAGNPVPGLTARDFEIYEDGVRQEIRAFTPVRVPVVARARTRGESDVQSTARQPMAASTPSSSTTCTPTRCDPTA